MSSPTPPDWGGETLQDVTPIDVPSSPPPADGPGDVTPGFDAPALAACPVCLERPSPEPDVHDTTYPCCGAFTHIGCMLQAARLHGRCPNCRAAIDHLPREPSIATRCRDLGISLDLVAPPSHQTAHTVVRDYAARTFSSADVPEPPEPERVRAVCCRRLSGPATGFMELPDARMHWAPVPHRNDRGIASWTPQWLCMRCQNMLPTARVQPPGPPPCCHRCLTLMSWEVDLASHTERWVCSRCPFAHMARPLALGPEPSPALVAPLEHAANASAQAQLPLSPVLPGLARRIETTGATEPADAPPAVAAPAAELGGVVQYAEAEPPVLPFAASTNSAVYVPLLLDAAGMLSAGARRAWHTHPTIGGWWPTAVNTLLARPFLPVPELAHAVEHVGQAFHPSSMRLSPSLRRFREWAALRHVQVSNCGPAGWALPRCSTARSIPHRAAGYLCRLHARTLG